MAIKDWRDVIYEDFPHPEVTLEMIYSTRRPSLVGCSRLMTRRLSTSRELEERREDSRNPLYEEERPSFQPSQEPPLTTRIYDFLAEILN